jgi:hypothetical protein
LLSFALWVPTWAQQHDGESRQRLWLRGHRDRIHAVFLYTFLARWVIIRFTPALTPGTVRGCGGRLQPWSSGCWSLCCAPASLTDGSVSCMARPAMRSPESHGSVGPKMVEAGPS